MNHLNNFQRSTSQLANSFYDVTIEASNTVCDAAVSIYETYSSDSHHEDLSESRDNEQPPFSGKALKGAQSYELFKILNSHSKPKVLVLEREIAEPLFRCIVSITELRAFNVKKILLLR